MQSLFTRIAWFRAQQYILAHWSSRIAVAGSYGRTLVASMICAAIKEHHHVRLGYPVKGEADIPLGILGVTHEKPHTNMVSFLIGTKQRELGQKEPSTIITELPLLVPGFAPLAAKKIVPKLVVLHHVASEHLDLFESKQNLTHEYEQILESLAGSAIVVANADDENIQEITEHARLNNISYGRSANADIRLTRAVRGDANAGIFIELIVANKNYEAFLPNLFAKEHVSAVLAAVACAHVRGVSISHALDAIQHMHIPDSALHMLETSHGATLLTESIESAEQMTESLKTLGSLKYAGRKIAVLGDIDQLGSETIPAHEGIGAQAGAVSTLVIFIGDTMRTAQRAASSAGRHIDTHHFATAQEAELWVSQHTKKDDLLYIAGGKHMNMEKIIDRLLAKTP